MALHRFADLVDVVNCSQVLLPNLFVDLFAVDINAPWSVNPDSDLPTLDLDDRDDDVVADDNGLARPTCKYEHQVTGNSMRVRVV